MDVVETGKEKEAERNTRALNDYVRKKVLLDSREGRLAQQRRIYRMQKSKANLKTALDETIKTLNETRKTLNEMKNKEVREIKKFKSECQRIRNETEARLQTWRERKKVLTAERRKEVQKRVRLQKKVEGLFSVRGVGSRRIPEEVVEFLEKSLDLSSFEAEERLGFDSLERDQLRDHFRKAHALINFWKNMLSS